MRWLEVLGVDTLVVSRPLETAGLEQTTAIDAVGDGSFVYSLSESLPFAWWPEATEVASTPGGAFDRVASSAAGSLPGVVPQAIEHRPAGRVVVRRRAADRILLEVDSPGGLLVVRRAYQPVWRARIGESELPVLPADLALVGVLVPPGHHQVTIEVAGSGEKSAAVVAVVVAIGLLLFAGWVARGGVDGNRTVSRATIVDRNLPKDS